MSMHPSRQAYVEEAEADDDAMEGISLADVRECTFQLQPAVAATDMY